MSTPDATQQEPAMTMMSDNMQSRIYVSHKWNYAGVPDPELGNHHWVVGPFLKGEAMLREGKDWITEPQEQKILESMAKTGCWKMFEPITGDVGYKWGEEVLTPKVHFYGRAGELATLELFSE